MKQKKTWEKILHAKRKGGISVPKKLEKTHDMPQTKKHKFKSLPIRSKTIRKKKENLPTKKSREQGYERRLKRLKKKSPSREGKGPVCERTRQEKEGGTHDIFVTEEELILTFSLLQ